MWTMQEQFHGLPEYLESRVFMIQPQHLLEQLGGSVFFKVFPLEAVGFKDLLPRDILHDKICTHVTSHMTSVYNRSQ